MQNDLRERTKAFALRIVRMFVALPKTSEARVLGNQVLRSGTSVGANYREAFRGRSRAEFVAKCGDSLRELEETGYWLELLVDGQIVTATKLAPLMYTQGIVGEIGFLKRIAAFVSGFFMPIPREPVSRADMRVWAVKTTALAAENLMLAFRAHGYDTCPMEGFDSVRARKILQIPRARAL